MAHHGQIAHQRRLRRVLVIKKPSDDLSTQIFIQIVKALAKRSITIIVDPSVSVALSNKERFPDLPPLLCYDATKLDELALTLDLIISIGGDGTLLHISQLFPGYCPLILPINTGSLGFLTPFSVTEVWHAIAKVISGKYEITERTRFISTIHRAWKVDSPEETQRLGAEENYYCLNEIVVDRGYSSYISKLETYVDGSLITVVQGDGLIVSTSTGSTAYSLSASGPIVHPGVPSIICTPICPHSLSFRPLVLPRTSSVTVRVAVGSRSTAWVSFDSRSRLELAEGDAVTTRIAQHNLLSVAKETASADFFCSLTELLGWNKRPIQKPLAQVAQVLDTRAVLETLPPALPAEEGVEAEEKGKPERPGKGVEEAAETEQLPFTRETEAYSEEDTARVFGEAAAAAPPPASQSFGFGVQEPAPLFVAHSSGMIAACARASGSSATTINRGIDLIAAHGIAEESYELGSQRRSAHVETLGDLMKDCIFNTLSHQATADAINSSGIDPKIAMNILSHQATLLEAARHREANAFIDEVAFLVKEVFQVLQQDHGLTRTRSGGIVTIGSDIETKDSNTTVQQTSLSSTSSSTTTSDDDDDDVKDTTPLISVGPGGAMHGARGADQKVERMQTPIEQQNKRKPPAQGVVVPSSLRSGVVAEMSSSVESEKEAGEPKIEKV